MTDYTNQPILVEHLKKGKEEAFIYIVDKYNQRLFGYAISLTNDRAKAQDVIQNVFLTTWEKRKKISINSSLQNYLFKAVHNEFLNQYKKERSTMVLEQKYFKALDRAAKNMDEGLIEKLMERVALEIQNLPPRCKEVFVLSRKDGLTNLEISDHLKISIKTVEAHLTKAFTELRCKMGDKLETILVLVFGGVNMDFKNDLDLGKT